MKMKKILGDENLSNENIIEIVENIVDFVSAYIKNTG